MDSRFIQDSFLFFIYGEKIVIFSQKRQSLLKSMYKFHWQRSCFILCSPCPVIMLIISEMVADALSYSLQLREYNWLPKLSTCHIGIMLSFPSLIEEVRSILADLHILDLGWHRRCHDYYKYLRQLFKHPANLICFN